MLTLNIIDTTHRLEDNPRTGGKVVLMISKSLTDSPIEEQVIYPKEFNGLPVVRAPKELGRRGLTNKNIIIHPSGLKLSKCPNGYIILCSHEGCGAIGSKDGIKCVKHAGSFRHCRHPECGKRAHFGIERKKPLYCSNHKQENMIDVIHNVCLSPDCNLLAYFGIKEGPSQYCSKHKSPEMIDVLHKRCIVEGCELIPSFGLEGSSIEYCSRHRPRDAIDLKHKTCLVSGCVIIASFGFVGGAKQFCSAHKSSGMINISGKRCLAPDCTVRPIFGIIGGAAEYCSKHKYDNMIDIVNPSCLHQGCLIRPCFGMRGGSLQYCNTHKLNDMINLIGRKCTYENCEIRARFGYKDGIPEYCNVHKLKKMINIRDKKCKFDGCEIRPSYNILFSKGKTHCKQHSNHNQYGYDKCNPICINSKCINPAYFIDPLDLNVYPIRCSEHKLTTDIELINRGCPNCLQILYYPINQQYCMNCGKYREKSIYNFREAMVKYILQDNNIDFIHNKSIIKGRSNFRPDFLIPSIFGYIIIEVDEYQHIRYYQHDEINRMRIIYHDIQYISPGKQVLFIRYNPDKYVGYNVKNKERLNYLSTVISGIKELTSIGTQLGYIKLFYDGFTGAPIIEPLTTIIDMTVNDVNYDDDSDNDSDSDI